MSSSVLPHFDSSIAMVGLVVLVGCVLTYLVMQCSLRRKLEALRQQIDQSLATKAGSSPSESVDRISVAAKSAPTKAIAQPVAPSHVQASPEELAHETLVVIAAAVSAFLGKSVRLRSARLIHPSEGNAWAQQGRVFVQASTI